jgi:6-phosphogluconolactonase (cycloisomerase 2 family)
MKRRSAKIRFAVATSICASTLGGRAWGSDNFVLFESGQVRPLALSPSGHLLFAVNTPDDRLEVFQVEAGKLRHLESIPVGLEPVSVAARSEHEV